MQFLVAFYLVKSLFELLGGIIVLAFRLLGFLLVGCRDLLWAIHDSRKN